MRGIVFISFLTLCFGLKFENPENTVIMVLDLNDTVEIPCPVQGVPKKSLIHWVKVTDNGDELVYSSSDPKNKNRSVNFNYDRINFTYTMRIKGVDKSDEGVYKCEAVDVSKKLDEYRTYSDCGYYKLCSTVEIRVLQAPIIQENSSRYLEIFENQSANLECNALGYPEPIIYWKRENNTKLPTGGSIYPDKILTIHSIKRQDEGTYYCVATNTIGKEVNRTVTIKVVEGAPIHQWDAK